VKAAYFFLLVPAVLIADQAQKRPASIKHGGPTETRSDWQYDYEVDINDELGVIRNFSAQAKAFLAWRISNTSLETVKAELLRLYDGERNYNVQANEKTNKKLFKELKAQAVAEQREKPVEGVRQLLIERERQRVFILAKAEATKIITERMKKELKMDEKTEITDEEILWKIEKEARAKAQVVEEQEADKFAAKLTVHKIDEYLDAEATEDAKATMVLQTWPRQPYFTRTMEALQNYAKQTHYPNWKDIPSNKLDFLDTLALNHQSVANAPPQMNSTLASNEDESSVKKHKSRKSIRFTANMHSAEGLEVFQKVKNFNSANNISNDGQLSMGRFFFNEVKKEIDGLFPFESADKETKTLNITDYLMRKGRPLE
jgi:hypothetical protein